MKLLITAAACLALAACGTGDRANKPSDAGEALNALAPATTPDNEAAGGWQRRGRDDRLQHHATLRAGAE